MSVRVSGLTKIYGRERALDNVSFEAKPGEVLGFLGPNGAGKTTAMRIITGYIPPTDGKASVCDFDVEKNPLAAKRNIGYLPENNPLYYDMYVREFLFFVAGIHRVANKKKRINEMIQITGLEKEQHKKIGALSKGYKQRVGLAQALLHDPQVLIMDEPTSGLDPNQLVEARRLIKELGREKTVILSTHIMQEVQAICNRVVIISKGKIVADATPESLLHKTGAEVNMRITIKQEVKQDELMKIPGVLAAEKIEDRTWRLHASSSIEETVFKTAVANGWIITSMQEEVIGLEQVFRELTK